MVLSAHLIMDRTVKNGQFSNLCHHDGLKKISFENVWFKTNKVKTNNCVTRWNAFSENFEIL